VPDPSGGIGRGVGSKPKFIVAVLVQLPDPLSLHLFTGFWLIPMHELLLLPLPPLQLPTFPFLFVFVRAAASCIGTTPNATDSIATTVTIESIARVEFFLYILTKVLVYLYIYIK
jgi:hypothetical protein